MRLSDAATAVAIELMYNRISAALLRRSLARREAASGI